MAENDPIDTSLAAGGTAGNSPEVDAGNQTPTEPTEEGLKFDLPEADKTKLAKFKTHNDLGKSYLELERKLGAAVVLPGKDASTDERDAFYKRLGRPDSQNGYELDPVFLPDGVTRDEVSEGKFRAIAFDLGLTKDQARLLNKYAKDQSIEMIQQGRQLKEKAKQEGSEALRKEHGLEYDKKIALVGLVNTRFGDTEGNWIRYLNTGPGNDPPMLRFLIKVGEAISEETLVHGRPPGTEPGEREPGVLSYPKRPELNKNQFRNVR